MSAKFHISQKMFVISETMALHGYGSVKPQNKNESSLFLQPKHAMGTQIG